MRQPTQTGVNQVPTEEDEAVVESLQEIRDMGLDEDGNAISEGDVDAFGEPFSTDD